ncbi:MAG: M20/M25/M40 family metallo-hydrolase [Alphaproteobacteria bacterium]|nr:M20/M25/M40 family metallo-hydrolase [Alphaproteobacteria bacterium]
MGQEHRRQLLAWIDQDRDAIVDFLSGFLQAKSPNPPGDTRLAGAHVRALLDAEALPYRIVAAKEHLPNIVGTFAGGAPGRHLVLNGHMDVFPAIEDLPGERGQWSGEVSEGRIYGRGASDMKCGTTASIMTYRYLHRLRDTLRGSLTLTVVSDEETGGRWGTRHIMETCPDEVLGDCCLNGEPSGLATVRFGEKGTLRLVFTVRTTGGHGAYPHLSASANKIAARIVAELEAITELRAELPERIAEVLAAADVQDAIDESLGAGARHVVDKATVNVGVLRGGLKINMMPDECVIEVDVRVPPGIPRGRVREIVAAIVAGHPEASVEERADHSYEASWCDPHGEMVGIIQDNVAALKGFRPKPIVSLGGSDGRYWRWRGIPAYLYGPSPRTMGRRDEHVTVDELLHIVRTHALSAFDYLSR